ncbi:MAG: hypothetical protein ACR2IJ_09165 [Fluviibacter sp.]
MKLYDNWRELVRRTWSIRFIVLAGILSGCEVALPLLGHKIEPGLFAGLSLFFTAAAFVARLVVQKGL